MERTARIKYLSEQGKTPKEIMEDVGISKYGTFYQICRRNNIKTNGKLGRPTGSKDKVVRKTAAYQLVKPELSKDDIEIIDKIKNL